MTLPVVQFCFAIAAGDKRLASDLLPQIPETDWFTDDPIMGVSPALFCLWASKQSPEVIKNKVNELNLSGLTNHPLRILSAENVSDASRLALPTITKQITTLLKAMISHMAPNTTGDAQKQFLLNACTTALEYILKDSSIELAERTRELAENMLIKFKGFHRDSSSEAPNARPTALDSVLLEQQKNFTPSWSSRDLNRRLDAFFQQRSCAAEVHEPSPPALRFTPKLRGY